MRKINKDSQITIFVIIAILIIAILLIIFYPQIKKAIVPATPYEMVPRECVQEATKEALNLVMLKGGNLNPELYFNYNDEKLPYLCYTSEWYQTCVMQVPLLKQTIEREASAFAQEKIIACYNTMIENLKNKGYNVQVSGTKTAQILLQPKKALINFGISLQLTKGEYKQTLESNSLKVNYNSNAYDIIMIASSIQNFEARYGDSIIDTYMAFYPNLKVEKLKQSDGTKVYIITDRDTQEKLQFATRSLAWPPGYAFA